MAPVGPAARSPRFRWQWTGPEVTWELVLLDDGFGEILRVPGIRGLEVGCEGALADALARGTHFHWLVEGDLGGRRFRCAPVPLVFPR